MSQALALHAADAAPPSRQTRPTGLYERLLMRAFAGFNHGSLRLIWPDGTERLLGDVSEDAEAEIRLRNPRGFFQRCVLFGNIGLGEGYVEGEWDTPDINAVITWFIRNITRTPSTQGSSTKLACTNFLRGINSLYHWMRPNSIQTSRKNIAEHYDLGNAFYKLWLDKTMTYSGARFTRSDESLEEAQYSKYDALCQKLRLKPGDSVLEIGCGWGGFCCHAAKNYGCHVTAVTISQEQYNFACERVRREGLQDRVEIRLQDYRHITGSFDKIASIEMVEAVGDAYLETYLAKCAEVLKPQGLLALQMITVPDCCHKNLRNGVDWIQKHIFPGSLLVSVGRVNQAINRTSNLFLHELEDLGSSYAKTLHLWWATFNSRLTEVMALGFDDRFIRKWNYYLQYCEAAFATRNISVVQVCYTRTNNETLHRAW